MEVKDWISLFVPIAADFLFSGFVVLIISKIIDKHYAQESKREHYAYTVMTQIHGHVAKLKLHMIHFQSGLLDDHEEAFKQFFLLAGDLQITFLDYEEYMVAYEAKHKNFFMVSDLRKILDTTKKAGFAMQLSSTHGSMMEVFAGHFNDIRELCQSVIQSYNKSLANS